jgi:hypothetical protein
MDLLATTTETQQRLFELAGLPQGWAGLIGVLVLAALCLLVVWFYRRERRVGAGRWLRAALAAVRCAVVLGLALVWLEPVIATYVYRSVSARVMVLADVSASMSVVDTDEPATGGLATENAKTSRQPVTRFARVRQQLSADDAHWLRRLAERNELTLAAFGDETERLPLPWGRAPSATQRSGSTTSGAGGPGQEDRSLTNAAAPPGAARPATANSPYGALDSLIPIRPRTDLGQALATVLDDVGDSPIAGIVVLSDGSVNKGLSPDEIVALARQFRAPIYAVGVGSPREPPNLRVTGLAAPATVPPGDPFQVRVELAATGLEPVEVEVELTVAASGAGGETRVAARRVVVGETETPGPLLFEARPPAPGEYTYRARVAALPGEAVTTDNVREATVQVLKESLRVLLVAGGPSFEYRFLTPLLQRDQSINVSCWLQSADAQALRDGTTIIERLPREPIELFAYDVILLLDPDPTELDASWAVMLRRWVDELGGGLLLQAGPQFTTRFLRDPRLHELVSLLPVTPDPDADMRLNAQGTYRTESSPVELPATATGRPLVALDADPTTNRDVWAALPGVWWYLPVLRAKPVATVLLEHGGAAQRNQYGPAVLMATQPFGAGRVAFLGFNSTWRWRAAAEPYFNRFWVQLVRYLAQARRQQISQRGSLALDRDTFGLGDYVKIEAHLLDPTYAPWHEPQVRAELIWADGTTQACLLAPIAEREGWFTGRLALEREGPAVLRVPLPGASEPGARATGPAVGTASQPAPEYLTQRFRVERPDIEMRSLRLREDILATLAEQTGGEYCRLADAQGLPDRIKKASERKPPQRAAVEPLWDRTWVMGVLAALLALEWTARRRNHLL